MQGIQTISIYTLNGKRVLKKRISNTETNLDLDISMIPNGSYIIQLAGAHTSKSKLIIIAKE